MMSDSSFSTPKPVIVEYSYFLNYFYLIFKLIIIIFNNRCVFFGLFRGIMSVQFVDCGLYVTGV